MNRSPFQLETYRKSFVQRNCSMCLTTAKNVHYNKSSMSTWENIYTIYFVTHNICPLFTVFQSSVSLYQHIVREGNENACLCCVSVYGGSGVRDLFTLFVTLCLLAAQMYPSGESDKSGEGRSRAGWRKTKNEIASEREGRKTDTRKLGTICLKPLAIAWNAETCRFSGETTTKLLSVHLFPFQRNVSSETKLILINAAKTLLQHKIKCT